jgi:hypothetical protein
MEYYTTIHPILPPHTKPMKQTASISISVSVLDATREWAAAENRPLSRHIEGILRDAIVQRMPTRRTSAATDSAARRSTPRKGRAA